MSFWCNLAAFILAMLQASVLMYVIVGFVKGRFKRFVCAHDDVEIGRVRFKSQAELLHSMGKCPNTWTSLKRKVEITYKCNKCKRLKHHSTYSE